MKLKLTLMSLIILIANSVIADLNTGKIFIDNLTPYTITPHVDDYNKTPLTFITSVPPNTQNVLAGGYTSADPTILLQFDTQIGPDKSCSTTPVITYDSKNKDSPFDIDRCSLWIDHKQYTIYAVADSPYVLFITIRPAE